MRIGTSLLLAWTAPPARLLNGIILRGYYARARRSLPAPAQDPAARRVAVLAPHPDDEVLGAGGMMARHAAAGAEVACIYITDGAAAHSALAGPRLAEVRREEAERATARLGVRERTFLDLPDGKFRAGAAEARLLARTLNRFHPDLLYVPFLLDGHRDHVETNRLLLTAEPFLKSDLPTTLMIRAYEVHGPLPPEILNCVRDISAEFPAKLQALACFRSHAMDFQGHLELHRYRSVLLARGERGMRPYRGPGAPAQGIAAETFLQLPLAEYTAWVKKVLAAEGDGLHRSFAPIARSQRLLFAFFKGSRKKARWAGRLRSRLACAPEPMSTRRAAKR